MSLSLILASGSVYRKRLMQQLQLEFMTCSPNIDELPRVKETAQAMVLRLAIEKAQAVAKIYPGHIIISSDQAAVLNNQIMGKPHYFEQALEQLKRASGNTVVFYTSLCVLNTASGCQQLAVDEYQVTFRPLTDSEIIHYIERDKPFDCAGSFKAESLGILLFESMQGNDYNSLIGLPLIKLTGMLKNEGISPV